MTTRTFKILTLGAIPLAGQTPLAKKLLNNKEGRCDKEHMKQHMLEEAQNIDKIFEQDGSMMDPQEMMEMMMNKGKNSLKPLPFESIMSKLQIFKQHEAVDGISINLNMPMSQQFQLGGQWILSNTKGSSFEVTSAVNNANGNPY